MHPLPVGGPRRPRLVVSNRLTPTLPPILRRICTRFYVRACRQRWEFGPGGKTVRAPIHSGRKRRRRKPPKWDRPNGHQRPTKDERCTWQICDGRNGAPYLLALALPPFGCSKNFMRAVGQRRVVESLSGMRGNRKDAHGKCMQNNGGK